ncbi:MAG: hypothetical protein WC969_02160 [Elusimicrobiota bacterium]|jgi:hypothetical protein
MKFLFVLLFTAASGSAAQAATGSAFNPDISVIGQFLGAAGNGSKEPRPFNLKEAEIGLQSVVDPYARADFFLSANPEGLEVEEGYLTWLTLPWGLQARAGKFRMEFGKFNRTHPGETPFADRPLAAAAFLGDEGLSEAGGHVSWLVPNPLDLFLQLDAQVANGPAADRSPAFAEGRKRDLLYLTHASLYADLTRAQNVAAGLSYAHGPDGATFDSVSQSSHALGTDLFGVDFTYRWREPSDKDRSLTWQTEYYWANREAVDPADAARKQDACPWGVFTYADWQFARRWHAGARYDYTKLVSNTQRRRGELAFLTFTPTEFSLLSLQGKHVLNEFDQHEWTMFFKLTFNIGPHGAHPF